MESAPEQSPIINPASATIETGFYIVGTFNRKVCRAASLFFFIVILLVAYFHLQLRVSGWTLVSFWIPFFIMLIATIELWFLPSMFALSAEERKKSHMFQVRFNDTSTVILVLLLALVCVAFATPSESPSLWIPTLSGSTVSCSSLAVPGVMLLDEHYQDGANLGPCLAVPTIVISYLVDLIGLFCVAQGLRRYVKIKEKIRMPDPSQELHLNSDVGAPPKNIIILLVIFGVFLAIALAISLPSLFS
jgi:hypothetical protein